MVEPIGEEWQLGLVGFPLDHSLSPRLHAAALEACGLQGEYRLYPVQPDDDAKLQALLRRLRDGSLDGLNVTIPHKQSVLKYLDQLTPAASGIGAVNTIFAKGQHLVGDNTDAPGFKADLARQTGWDLDTLRPTTLTPPTALVLGAGGSARAVVYSLASQGWQLWICARHSKQAFKLINDLENFFIQLPKHLPWEALNRATHLIPSAVNLLVNTTPLGMMPDISASPWPEGVNLPTDAFLYDLVYNPPETTFVRLARSAGLPAINGMGMLVEQAALAFERWTGCSAPRQAMVDAVKDWSYLETS